MRVWIIKTESISGHTSEYIFTAQNISELKKEFIKRFTKEYYNDITLVKRIGNIEND